MRAVWDEQNAMWWFSVLDIVALLTNQDNYTKTCNYWKYLKAKLKKENRQVVSATAQLKFLAPDGRKRLADMLDYTSIIALDESKPFHNRICSYLNNKVMSIKGFNELAFIMDYGESDSVILYKELHADFLLIDEKKARIIAEIFGINCIGKLELLAISKDKGFIKDLKPLFEMFLENHRYYSIDLLNSLLTQKDENIIRNKA